MRISDWSSDVCSPDLTAARGADGRSRQQRRRRRYRGDGAEAFGEPPEGPARHLGAGQRGARDPWLRQSVDIDQARAVDPAQQFRSEEHTSELQSLMRISYAVFCLKQKLYSYCISYLHHSPQNLTYTQQTY